MGDILNYSVPLANPIVTTINNGTQVVAILPRTTYEKILIGHNFFVVNNLSVSDFVSTATFTPYGFLPFKARIYIENVNPIQALWNDESLYENVGMCIQYLAPIPIKANAQLILHFSNLNPSAVNKVLTTFFVIRTVV